jgi:large subunit ribosomal protein L18
MDKKESRLRRARRTRAKIRELAVFRLTVHRTPQHTYAQVIAPNGSEVVAAASTLDEQVRAALKDSSIGHSGNVKAAAVVGRLIAERAKQKGVSSVAFDRAGFKYHGRVKALADAAREGGLQF